MKERSLKDEITILWLALFVVTLYAAVWSVAESNDMAAIKKRLEALEHSKPAKQVIPVKVTSGLPLPKDVTKEQVEKALAWRSR